MENDGGKGDRRKSGNSLGILAITLAILVIGGITLYRLNLQTPDSQIGQVLNSPS